MKNNKEILKEARKGIPFLASYDGQEYIVTDVIEIKNEDTGAWEIKYQYKLVNDPSRTFGRDIEVFNSKYKKIKSL